MSDKKIYIYSGPIQTGKTTRIIEWVKDKKCGGILAPVIKGERHMKNISSGELKNLESIKDSTKTIQIGRYNFSGEVFEWGKDVIEAAASTEIDWLIIDEYGKLEMKDEGLEPSITKIINEWKDSKSFNILIIVRDYLVNDLLNKFKTVKEEIKPFELK